MAEEADVIPKLISIASDLTVSEELRAKAISHLGAVGSREALVALLDLVGNEGFSRKERMLALWQSGKILRPRRPWWYFLRFRGR